MTPALSLPSALVLCLALSGPALALSPFTATPMPWTDTAQGSEPEIAVVTRDDTAGPVEIPAPVPKDR